MTYLEHLAIDQTQRKIKECRLVIMMFENDRSKGKHCSQADRWSYQRAKEQLADAEQTLIQLEEIANEC
ncbi:hypothetical protein [Marinobacterium litorale]|uniref:hypothetical protein n=1 Tax=Marinobacterium litorale TaxID=404770 RepID=UPI0004128FAA|nr:hypothetical protein [Marinobacterium litorale]